MSNISKPNSFSSGTTISSSEVNDNFDTIYNDYNGNISAANLADSAVSTAKIADGAVTAAKLATDIVDTGWAALSGTHSVSTGYNAGNRSFTIATSADHTSTLSPGMRYKLTRGTTPSTQCADFESGSSQYASKSSPSGITFTTTFSAEAWVKLESYSGATNGIVARRNADTAGWSFDINSAGRVTLTGLRIASNNKLIRAYQSLPLNKWVHVAATMDMSAGDTSAQKIWIDGVEVPREYSLTGTASALVQGTVDLTVGASKSDGSLNMDGEISDVRVWSDNRTTTEIQDNMYQALVGNETNLVGYWKLDGDFTDETSNSNDLTASGGVVATTADNPFNATEYGVITAVSASTVTVFCPEGYGIPNETLTNPFYSTQSTPFGFPRDKGKWTVETVSYYAEGATTAAATKTNLYTPIGSWKFSFSAQTNHNSSASNLEQGSDIWISSSGTAVYNPLLFSRHSETIQGTVTHFIRSVQSASTYIDLTTALTLTLVIQQVNTVGANIIGTQRPTRITAECAYI